MRAKLILVISYFLMLLFSIDGKDGGSIASFLNDAPRSSTLIKKILLEVPVFVVGPNGLKEGQELTYNYGDDARKMFWRKVGSFIKVFFPN